MIKRSTILAISFLLIACEVDDGAQPKTEITLLGKWKFVSHIVSDCALSSDNMEDRCSGTAAECGVLTIEEKSWSWTSTLSDGSVYTESGGYTVSSNTITLTGPSGPGTKKYSISGSALTYTASTLKFINTSDSNGCTYTETYAKYNQPSVPSN